MWVERVGGTLALRPHPRLGEVQEGEHHSNISHSYAVAAVWQGLGVGLSHQVRRKQQQGRG